MQRVIERILNLLAFLLTVERPVTADEIRQTVAGYDQPTDEAFRRTFERDKDLLRSLGVPLHTTPTDVWEVELGYVVRSDEYVLDDPGFTEDERRALLVAAETVRFGGETTSLAAIFKLGGSVGALTPAPVAADLGYDLQTLGAAFDDPFLTNSERWIREVFRCPVLSRSPEEHEISAMGMRQKIVRARFRI